MCITERVELRRESVSITERVELRRESVSITERVELRERVCVYYRERVEEGESV